MVNVDVDIEDSLIVAQELKNAQYNICDERPLVILLAGSRFDERTVDIAETASLALFGMMQTSSPIHCDIALLPVESCRALHTASCTDTAEFKKAVKYWTVITNIEAALLFLIRLHIVRRYFLEELNIFVSMELCHFDVGSRFGAL